MRPLLLLVALLAIPPDAAAASTWKWPVRGEVISHYRNGDDPYSAGQHRGIDVAAVVGTPVVAAVDGSVEFAGAVGSAGLTVSQRTADGRHQLSYLHLSQIAVRRGEQVAAGDRLGEVGVSGRRSAEPPHLHFGVREAGARHGYLDPLRFLAPSPGAEPGPQPRPVPVPVPVAEPTRPAPAPAPVAAPAPVPVPVVAPAAAAEPAPVPALGPAPAATVPGRTLARVAAVSASPDASPTEAHRSDPARASAVVPGTGPALPERAGHHGEAPAPRPTGAGGGVDVGWLSACAGLVAAASLLAGSRGARRGHAPVRTAFGALLRAASRG